MNFSKAATKQVQQIKHKRLRKERVKKEIKNCKIQIKRRATSMKLVETPTHTAARTYIQHILPVRLANQPELQSYIALNALEYAVYFAFQLLVRHNCKIQYISLFSFLHCTDSTATDCLLHATNLFTRINEQRRAATLPHHRHHAAVQGNYALFFWSSFQLRQNDGCCWACDFCFIFFLFNFTYSYLY